MNQRLLRLRNLTMDARADRIPGTAVAHPGQSELAVEELAGGGLQLAGYPQTRAAAELLASALDGEVR